MIWATAFEFADKVIKHFLLNWMFLSLALFNEKRLQRLKCHFSERTIFIPSIAKHEYKQLETRYNELI